MAKIYVTGGHGGKDPGCVYGTRREKDYTLPLALAVIAKLKSNGHDVFTDRTTDKDSLINDKVRQANKAKVDAVVDIHLNSGGGTGCEVYHTIINGGGKGRNLAVKICDQLAQLGYRNRGAKTKTDKSGNDYFGIIRQTNAPAVLVECCFLDCDADMALFDTGRVAEKIAAGISSMWPAVKKTPPAAAQSTKNPYGKPLLLLKVGSKGNGVRWLQWELNQSGAKLTIDGDFGAKTKAAVIAFQRKAKITVDGKAWRETFGALEKAV
jgi:N-acetylmuramoyl-L-alanine amidase